MSNKLPNPKKSIYKIQVENKGIIFNIILKKHPNTKKITIRPYWKEFRNFIITMPSVTSYKYVINWVQQHKEWLNTTWEKQIHYCYWYNLSTLTIAGNKLALILEKSNKNQILQQDNQLIVKYKDKVDSLNFVKWSIKIAKEIFTKLATEYCNILNTSFNKIILKDNTSKWGSCSSLRNLTFNWRIIFAPLEVIQYLTLHEVAHLVYFNHSSDFWQLVASVQPDYLQAKNWLHLNGKKLYSILV